MNIQASSDPTIIETKECEICHLVDWKYTCPRCFAHTCSLICVRQHKTDAQCSGERDKTGYVPLKKYNESNMMSDYTYLEDVSRQSDNIARARNDYTPYTKGKLRAVNKQANYIGILYHSLPEGMTRHKHNQSNYNTRSRQIYWTIESNFYNKNNEKKTYLEHGFPGSKPCNDFFQNILFSDTPRGKDSHSIIRHELKEFIDAGLEQFKVALKKEKAPKGHFVDITSMMNLSLVDIMRGETIVEYPTFYIWLKDDPQPADILCLEEKKVLIRPFKRKQEDTDREEDKQDDKEEDGAEGEDKREEKRAKLEIEDEDTSDHEEDDAIEETEEADKVENTEEIEEAEKVEAKEEEEEEEEEETEMAKKIEAKIEVEELKGEEEQTGNSELRI